MIAGGFASSDVTSGEASAMMMNDNITDFDAPCQTQHGQHSGFNEEANTGNSAARDQNCFSCYQRHMLPSLRRVDEPARTLTARGNNVIAVVQTLPISSS